MSEDPTSNTEKLKIAQHFLLSSLPGQLQEEVVFLDVKKILAEDIITDSLVNGIARAANR